MADEGHSGSRRNIAEDREQAFRAGQSGGQGESGNITPDWQSEAEASGKDGRVSRCGRGAEPPVNGKQPAGWAVDHDAVDDEDHRSACGRSHLWSFLPLIDLRGWYS